MSIVVVDYDPQWSVVFDQLRMSIWPTISDVAVAVEHVGSTSVVGLAAKPVIDMTIVVANQHNLATVIDRLAGIGYRHRGDLGITGREAFGMPSHCPAHHLYACVQGSLPLRNHLSLRDRLRRDPAAAAAYGALKKQLAERFADDIDAYVDGKTELIIALLADGEFDSTELTEINAVNSLPLDKDQPCGNS